MARIPKSTVVDTPQKVTLHMEDPQLVATALLYRAQMYCMNMADRQRGPRSNEQRKDYNDASKLLRDTRESLQFRPWFW